MLPPEFLERPTYQTNFAEGRIRRFFRFEQWTEIDFNGKIITVVKAPEFRIDEDGNYGLVKTENDDRELVQIRRPIPQMHSLIFYAYSVGSWAGRGEDIDLAIAYNLGVYDQKVAELAKDNVIPIQIVDFIYDQVA